MKTKVFIFDVVTSHGRRNEEKIIDNYTIEIFSSTEKKAEKSAIKSIRNMFEGHVFSYIRPRLLNIQTLSEHITNQKS